MKVSDEAIREALRKESKVDKQWADIIKVGFALILWMSVCAMGYLRG
ncbi:hypothetical protein [Desulforamulus aquiferis]|uniref:Uncharacterized protein n=1 Tax=Desulforamulus aquiferis TaxID=1397668 RepID=A0AAW7ZL44_9FIRM|nr:hypothetical protein [Desulforamulus aquiferis]MDO7789126.1 hypothetical protein [Desulforamulus aquiferis]